jgi:hypothetical protein
MSIDSGINQDVQAKMNAYRGNPDALVQQYQQGQQLIDLLALQKLKSEKEAAAREMQLKMGGGAKPTVGQQREDEVLDLTKQELAQNTTEAMQNDQRQKQEAAKELVERSAQAPVESQSPMMRGVAGLPANNLSTKFMASGGIVAFDQGGSTDPLAGVSGVGPEAMARDRERLERARQEEEERRAIRRAYDVQSGLIATAPPVSTEQAQAQDIESGQSQSAPAAPAAPRAVAPSGIASVAGADPRAIALRDQIAQYIGFSPEERARREKGMSELAALDAARFDPKRRADRAITRFLLNAGGRSSLAGALQSGGAGIVNYNEGMDAQERQALLGRQKQVDELIAADVGTRKSAFDLGLKSAIDYAQIAAKQAANALGRESMDQNRVLAVLSSLQGRYTDAVKQVDTLYSNEVKNLGIFGTPTPEQKQALEAAEIKRQLGIREISNRLQPAIRQAEIKAGVPSASAGFTLQSVTPARPNP